MHHKQSDDPWFVNKAFVFCGRLAKSKGLHHIINAWLLLQEQKPTTCPPLWVIGGTPQEIKEIRKLVANKDRLQVSEITGMLMWWGYLDERGFSALLLRSLCLLFHSEYEPGGRVIIEAMTQKIPVIATPHGFARDLVKDGLSGFIVNFGDEKALNEKMLMFAENRELTIKLGNNASQIISKAMRDWNFYGTHSAAYKAFSTQE